MFFKIEKNKIKGFTLIELLVVIAIITILASVVLININPQKQTNKAEDVKKKHNLVQLRSLGILYLHNHDNSYEDFCTNDVDAAILVTDTGANCYDSVDAWAAEVTLSGVTAESRYCIDSTGYAGDSASSLGPNDTDCNQ